MGKTELEKMAAQASMPQDTQIKALMKFVAIREVDGELQEWGYKELLDAKIHLDEATKTMEEQKKWVSDQLKSALELVGKEAVKIRDGMVLKIGRGATASKIEPTKLLEQGVTVEQIQAATVPGKPYTFAQIERPKK